MVPLSKIVTKVCLHFFSIEDDVDIHKLDSILKSMGVKLSDNQMRDLKKNLQVDGEI